MRERTPPTLMVGYLKAKNWLTPGKITAHKRPRHQARMVLTKTLVQSDDTG
jgi:hypothetical protein